MTDLLLGYHRFVAASGGRLYAGSVGGGVVLCHPQQSLLVLGPPRAGKTTAVAVPNTLGAPGAVVSASTKADVLAATLPVRAAMGRCWLFDPSGSVRPPAGVERVRWSPVASARTWEDALTMARSMSRAARGRAVAGDADHWTERAEALLAPLLHAAHLKGAGMATATGWVLRHDLDEAAAILRSDGPPLAADVLAGIAATDPRERSGIWSTAAGVLAAYRSETALDATDCPNFDPAGLAAGRDTVFICSPARSQDLMAPVVVAFLDQVRSGAYAGAGRHLPLTLVLDELANIAPIPDLPSLVSEGGGQGVLTVGCLQDLSQARSRWGPAAEGFLTLFGAKLVMPGIADMHTLELVSRLGGEVEVPGAAVSRGPWWAGARGTPTTTWSGHRQRAIPVESVRQQRPGTALLLRGYEPPAVVGLPPYWAVEALVARPLPRRRSRSISW